LATSLASKDVFVDIIGSDEIDSPEFHVAPNLRFLSFRGSQGNRASLCRKVSKLLVYYAKLVRYVGRSRPKILHILWNYKLEQFERTILMVYYKVMRKRVALTAHNVNQARRDGNDSWFNRLTLRIQYRLCDHMFVHTQKMKDELRQEFGVAEGAVTVIPYPVNNAFPDTELTPNEAKRRLGIQEEEKAILFFGRIVPYKGIEYLLEACRLLVADKQVKYRLIIAGEPKKEAQEYCRGIERTVANSFAQGEIILKMQFIPDDEMELYFKAADVTVLSYTEVFQSGVLFLAYSFGLPVIVSDVGSFRDDIISGETGLVCKPCDANGLADAIETYFASDLFRNLDQHRPRIRDYANARNSWGVVGQLTRDVYVELSGT